MHPETVYFGGGTPGLLAPGQVERLLVAFAPLQSEEITLEANPESLTPEKLEGWRAAGVNRLSLGVQTAREESLRRLGRPHTAGQAREGLAMAVAAGFDNISGDIMLALPGYSQAEFDETLALLREGGVAHISAYLLKLEPDTPFGRHPPRDIPGEDEAADYYLYAVEQLEQAGYRQYEISNFARPGFESRHNLAYWNLDDWLGLGPAAHSHLAGRRFSFVADLNRWLAGAQPLPEGDTTAEDYIMLRLRLNDGINEPKLAARFGKKLSAAQQTFLCSVGHAGYAARIKDGWRLTSRGLLVQNTLLAELLRYPLEEGEIKGDR